jgi:toxin secretion/phage lysis holin
MEHGITSYMYILLIALTFSDIALGTARAFVRKKINSSIAKSGILKNALLLIIPAILYPFADMIGYRTMGDAFIGFLALSQGYSVVENWVGLGLPFNENWESFFDDKKMEQKHRIGTVHTDVIVPDEFDKKL